MSTSKIRSAYSAVRQTWKEYFVIRLHFAVSLLGLLGLILSLGGRTINEIVWPIIMVATFLALGEFALRVSKKLSKNPDEKPRHDRKERTRRDIFGLLAMLALGALFLWIK